MHHLHILPDILGNMSDLFTLRDSNFIS